MSELRVGATVRGPSGDLGKVDALVIDPTRNAVTHLVVTHDPLAPRLLVGLDHVTASSPEVAEIDLAEEELHRCEPFDEPQFNAPGTAWSVNDVEYEPGAYFLEPFASPADAYALTEHERIPKGEVTIRRHDEVFSLDGTKVGHVDEFLVDPEDGHVTHVVLREGHVLRHDDDVVVPVAGARMEEGRVVLGIDLPAVHDLDRIPVTRHGHVREGDLRAD